MFRNLVAPSDEGPADFPKLFVDVFPASSQIIGFVRRPFFSSGTQNVIGGILLIENKKRSIVYVRSFT